jgi:hypothetical protein
MFIGRRRYAASTRTGSVDLEKGQFVWLQPNTLFGQLPIVQNITQMERQELEPILGANNIQLFRNFNLIKVIPTGRSFLLQGINPDDSKASTKPFLDIQSSPTERGNAQAYVRFLESGTYHKIAQLLEAKVRDRLEEQQTAAQFDKFATLAQPLSFFPQILDSIVNPETFKHLLSLPRIRLKFDAVNRTIAIKDSTNLDLFLLRSNQLNYLILLHVIFQYGYYQAFDYPLPEVVQNSLIVLSVQGKTSVPYCYLEPRIQDIFLQEFQPQEEVMVEFLQADTLENSLLIFSSDQLSTRVYPRLKLTDVRTPELLSMIYNFAYPELKQQSQWQSQWQKAAVIFRFMSLYELFQNEEFKHFHLISIPLSKLLEVDFTAEMKNDLTKLAANDQVEVHFVNDSNDLHIDLRLVFKRTEDPQGVANFSNTVIMSHRNPHFYDCIELITQLWSHSEERLRFLDTTWLNKLVERLRFAGNYWLSYFELQPHLERLAASENPQIASLVRNLYAEGEDSKRLYFRYFLGIYGEELIISLYPIFSSHRSPLTLNPEVTEVNSIKLNIFTSRTQEYAGFCRKVLELAKKLLDLGANLDEERVRFNIPKVIKKIETHTLALLQRYTPTFPEMIDRLQAMLLDMILYAPQSHHHYLDGYPVDDPLSKLKQRFFQLTPDEKSVNLLNPVYTTKYTEDPIMRHNLAAWRSRRYPNQDFLLLMIQTLQFEDQRKQLQLQQDQAHRVEALSLMLDTLLQSVQAITRYEIQVIAQQPNSVLTIPEIQAKIQTLLAASETMETEWQTILEVISHQNQPIQKAKKIVSEPENYSTNGRPQPTVQKSPDAQKIRGAELADLSDVDG